MTEIDRQIDKAKNEQEVFLVEIKNSHNKFAESLLLGEGEKIKKEINKPIIIPKQKKIIYKIKKFFEKIINTIG